jgi:dimethylsulfone monooxygenase
MRLGIWTPAPQTIRPDPRVKPFFEALTRNGGGVDESYRYAADTLRRAEDLGFGVTLIAQRFLGPDLDSWIFATALATQTRSIDIMAALHPGIMDPRIAAKMGASIDRISGGRFLVNIVNGGRPREFEVFGEWIERSAPRYARMHEFIKVLKGLWTQDDFSFHGEFFNIGHGSVPTRPVRAPHPPIYAASYEDEGQAIVARECDCWFVAYDKDFRKYEDNVRRIERDIATMERRVAELGRRMSYGINASIVIGKSDADAEAKVDAYLDELKRDPSIGVGMAGLGAALIGSPETIARRIQRYEDIGANLLMLSFYPMREGLDEFAQRIMPLMSNVELAPAFA